LLAWAEDQPFYDDLLSTSDEMIEAISGLAGNRELRALLREAADGRIHADILSEDGLEAVRLLAAYVLEFPPYGQISAPLGALEHVISAIRHRIGNQPGAWLNSLALIGLRILSSSIGGDGVDEKPFRRQRRKPNKLAIQVTDELQTLIEADGARVLSPKLCRNPIGLNRLLRKYGPEALSTIRSCLTRAMIDGGEIAKITTWNYFIGALDGEKQAAEREAQGLRPGDFPGWRYADRRE